MKVCHLTPTYFSEASVVGGGERYVFNIAEAIHKYSRGRTQQVVVGLGKSASNFDYADIPVRVKAIDWVEHSAMSAGSDEIRFEILSADIVHIHQSLTDFGLNALCIAKSLGKKVVLTDLGGEANNIFVKGEAVRFADGLISISKFAESCIERIGNVLHEVIIGPIDTEKFRPIAGSARDPISAICVSRLLPHKGLDKVIEALPPGVKLTIVGKPYHEPYFELLKHLALNKNVFFETDFVDEGLVLAYNRSSIFVQASTFVDCYGNFYPKPELMGITALEALSCGLPIYLSDVASFPELINSPSIGETFSSVAELQDIFVRLRDGKIIPASKAKECRAAAVNQYSYLEVGRRFVDFYDRVLESANANLGRK